VKPPSLWRAVCRRSSIGFPLVPHHRNPGGGVSGLGTVRSRTVAT